MSDEPAGEAAQPHLAIVSGLPFGVFLFETEEVIVGRAPDVQFRLNHLEVSRRHCRFLVENGTLFVEDLGSRWGTKVNGAAIAERTALTPGDRISLGAVVLLFDIGEPREIPPAGASIGAEDATLRVLLRGAEVTTVPLGGSLMIGRDNDCDVALAAPAVSRRHAQVQATAAGFRVIDQRSRAGSFVNGQRFDEHDLVIGDRLQIGPFYFQFDGLALRRVSGTPGAPIETIHISRKIGGVTVLDDVTMTFDACQFAGIIGPSGAGKSSLLDAISGRRAPTAGEVRMDGVNMYGSGEKPVAGFVPQEDIVHHELTVSEGLRFAAQLRLPRGTPRLELQKLIFLTMDQLGIRERAGTRIANLSGGQRKRVSVGAELLARPPVLFLDEPSSGLDPATEFKLMELLRDLTDTGCTIVCTTHVLENVYLMDQLAVMSAGRLIFQGTPEAAREHFGVARLSGLYDRLGGLESYRREPPLRDPAGVRPQRLPSPARKRSSLYTATILLARQWAVLRSDFRNLWMLAGQPVLIAALVSWVTDDEALTLFFAYIATFWFGCSNAAQEIVRELAIYRRERMVGVGRNAYLASKFIFLGAITLAQALLFYGTIQLGEGGITGSITWQLAGLLGAALAAVGIGSAISALASNVMQAVLLVPAFLIPLILFSGFTVPANEMKPAVAAVAELTPTFGAQTAMDVSFLWQRRIDHQSLGDHWTSFRNLNRDKKLRTGQTYAQIRPGVTGVAVQFAWMLGGYGIAWAALRIRERQ